MYNGRCVRVCMHLVRLARVCGACATSCAGCERVYEPQRRKIGMSRRAMHGANPDPASARRPLCAPRVSTPTLSRRIAAAPLHIPAHAPSLAGATSVWCVCCHVRAGCVGGGASRRASNSRLRPVVSRPRRMSSVLSSDTFISLKSMGGAPLPPPAAAEYVSERGCFPPAEVGEVGCVAPLAGPSFPGERSSAVRLFVCGAEEGADGPLGSSSIGTSGAARWFARIHAVHTSCVRRHRSSFIARRSVSCSLQPASCCKRLRCRNSCKRWALRRFRAFGRLSCRSPCCAASSSFDFD